MMTEKHNLFGILAEKSVVSKKEHLFAPGITASLNPYSYWVASNEPKVWAGFDRLIMDGQVMVNLLRGAGVQVDRIAPDMTGMMPDLFAHCLENEKSIFFLGAKAHEVEGSVKQFRNSYPGLHVLGFRDGYYSDEKEVIAMLIEKAPDFLLVGMGSPRQEKFLLNLKNAGFKGCAFTCGAFLHQSSKGLQYYPAWVDKLHLRWLYRMWDEPRLIRRYLVEYPQALQKIKNDRRAYMSALNKNL